MLLDGSLATSFEAPIAPYACRNTMQKQAASGEHVEAATFKYCEKWRG
jgi:hypothetical protein